MAYRYLSATEKAVALTLGAFIAYLDDVTEKWQELKRPKDRVKYAKMAKSFASKVLVDILKDVHPEQVAKLTGGDVPLYRRGADSTLIKQNVRVPGALDKMEVVVKYKDEAVREYAKIEKLDSVIAMEVGDLDKLIYFGLASCNLCDLCGADVEACDMRQLFIKYEAMPLNTEPGDGCPFRN